MGKILKVVFKVIFSSLIPAICTYLSQPDNLLDWLQKKEYISAEIDLALFRHCMSILSIVFTFLFLTVPLVLSNLQKISSQGQRDRLLKQNKDIFETTLKKQLNLEHCKLNIRIFVPRITLIQRIAKCLKIQTKVVFYIKNIYGLAENDITDNLKFEAYPETQGLVGACYNQKAILYDDDLEKSNETNYNLTHYQIAKTNQLKFILVCPIFSEGEEIVSIVSLDTCDSIKLQEDQKEKLRSLVLNYTQSLYECIPDFFKAKGGIL